MDEKRCPRCGTVKPVSDFYRNRGRRDGLTSECRLCWDERKRAWKEANRQKYLAQQRESQARHRRAAPEKVRAAKREEYRALKRELFDHYGWRCACCGTGANLSIDHVDGDGAEHRAMVTGDPTGHKGGDGIYREIRRQGFPPGYQTLCRACNNSKKNSPVCRLHHGDIRADAAKVLRNAGWPFSQIAAALGVSHSRAYQFVSEARP